MNVEQSDQAIVTRGDKAGQLAFVLWQEALHPRLGSIWRVRFHQPQLFTRISSDGGASFRDGVAFGRDGLMPDTWLRPVERPASVEVLQLDIDLRKPASPPEVLDVPLRWPDGWRDELQCR